MFVNLFKLGGGSRMPQMINTLPCCYQQNKLGVVIWISFSSVQFPWQRYVLTVSRQSVLIELVHERNNHNHPVRTILSVAERACLPSKKSKPRAEVKPDELNLNQGDGAGKERNKGATWTWPSFCSPFHEKTHIAEFCRKEAGDMSCALAWFSFQFTVNRVTCLETDQSRLKNTRDVLFPLYRHATNFER